MPLSVLGRDVHQGIRSQARVSSCAPDMPLFVGMESLILKKENGMFLLCLCLPFSLNLGIALSIISYFRS
jgi:hypothetical protein